MSELLGISSNKEVNINFTPESTNLYSEKPKNGWGVAFYPNKSLNCQIFKEDNMMKASSLLEFVSDNNLIYSKIILNHIRYLSESESFENTLPFSRELFGQHWTFIHNGSSTMENYFTRYLKENNNKIDFIPMGQTSSDKAFCIILNEIKKHILPEISIQKKDENIKLICSYDFEELQKNIFKTCSSIMNSGTNFNMILSNGEYLFTFFSGYNKLYYLLRDGNTIKADAIRFKNSDIAPIKIGLEKDPNEKAYIIASEILTEGEEWTAFKAGEMLVFKNGELIYKNNPILNEEIKIVDDVEVYDSFSELDNKESDRNVIGLSEKLKAILDLKDGDKVKVVNASKEVELTVYNSDKKLLKGGVSQAENSEIHACIPHRIREKLNLKQVVFREHYRHFQKLFTNVSILKLS